ncbi:MAG: SRPBCC family protein [Phycisphaeraceae bacterium]|nr:SRPBCC family protein [Phycisphaeraceae bacterium]
MTRVTLSPRWGVSATTSVRLDASTDEIWAVMQRLSRFVAADPYHTHLADAQGNRLETMPPRGTAIRIGHGVGFNWFDRVGTITRVVPGQCFAFTDLSQREPNAGFPHIYKYMLIPIGEDACELTLSVRGRWSARWLPRFAVRAWLGWVMIQANWSLRMHTTHRIDRLRRQNSKATTAPERKAANQ